MKKFINASLLTAAVVVAGSAATWAVLLNSYPYYNCPSMEKYSPLVVGVNYCHTGTNMKPSEYSACLKEYNEKYGKVRQEYRQHKCELSEVRYIQQFYGATSCKVEYTEGKDPKIVGTESKTMTRNTSQADKCLAKLKAVLQKAYPDIEEQQ